MRKFIVKHFVLSYNIKIGKTYYSAPRASRIIFPLFILSGISLLLTENTSPIFIVPFSATVISLLIAFVYLWIWPAKWKELDNSQKKQAADAVSSGQLSMVLSKEEWEELKSFLDKA